MKRSAESITSIENFLPAQKEVVSLGNETAIASLAWGNRVNNDQLIRIVQQSFGKHPKINDFIETINGSGIKVRHHTPPEFQIRDRDLLAQHHIKIGAEVALETASFNGWAKEEVDVLIATASVPPCEDFAERIAERAGFINAKTRLYCLACDGFVAALHDVLREAQSDENPLEITEETRVVIAAVEELSLGINHRALRGEIPLEEIPNIESLIACAAIFGNGATSFAFRPKNFRLLAGKTFIIPDKKGVIRTPKWLGYQVSPSGEDVREWYQVGEGAEERFLYSGERVMMEVPMASGNDMEMMPKRTAIFFARHVPPATFAVLDEYYQSRYYQETGQPIRTIVSHQPSGGVLTMVGGRTNGFLEEAGYESVETPWLLDKVKMGNVSSATTLLTLMQLGKEGKIPIGAFGVLGFGVGAAVTPIVVEML